MASGRKNYFRHSFFARNDIKLRRFRDEIGVGFYFYYFSLLEQCGEASSDNLKDNYEFHDSIIRSLWCINLKKSERVASVMHSTGLLFFEKRENTFYFEIPNFSKYLGKYETKLDSNSPNKRKENEIKENKSKVKEIKDTSGKPDFVQQVLDFLNSELGTKYKSSSKKTVQLISTRRQEGFTFEDFQLVIRKKVSEWVNTEMAMYLRPETLFGTKFESYLNQTEGPKKFKSKFAEDYKKDDAEDKDWVNDFCRKSIAGEFDE